MKALATYAGGAAMIGIVVVLIVPLPPILLDALLGVDIFGSALILLLSISVTEPLEFSAFAPALLLATLFRLALDVSATRLILSQGHVEGGAGAVIPAFGAFVVRGNLVVGLIVFAILVTIQFIVIAAGSQRVAEVAARFTLDAMPGKQMAIDADVHAGVLDSEGARRKRERVQQEADFYGAMDGAGKFVKGDAIAALVIVALNLAGGLLVGVAYRGLSPRDALDTFALLSIGNALVTTLPAFLLSTAMGMMVTRVAADGSLGVELGAQLFERPELVRTAACLMLALAFVPGLPAALFLSLGCAAFGAAQLAVRRRAARGVARGNESAAARRAAVRRPEMALGLVGVDALTIDFGSELAALLGSPHADALLDRIGEVRRSLAAEIGIVLPGVRLRDELSREGASYALRVRDDVVGEGMLRLDRMLAVADESALCELAGERVDEPVYGLPACWIAPEDREGALARGALVFDPISVIGSHLAECARRHAATLLGRQEFATLLEHLRSSVPVLVKEIASDGSLSPALAHKVFCALLAERVWPRDPVATLEALVEASAGTRDWRDLTEAVRRTLVPALLRRRGLRILRPILLAPEFERDLVAAWTRDAQAGADPGAALHLRREFERYAAAAPRGGRIALCTASFRSILAEFVQRSGVEVEVFSFAEIPGECSVEPAAIVAYEPRQVGQRPVIVSA